MTVNEHIIWSSQLWITSIRLCVDVEPPKDLYYLSIHSLSLSGMYACASTCNLNTPFLPIRNGDYVPSFDEYSLTCLFLLHLHPNFLTILVCPSSRPRCGRTRNSTKHCKSINVRWLWGGWGYGRAVCVLIATWLAVAFLILSQLFI